MNQAVGLSQMMTGAKIQQKIIIPNPANSDTNSLLRHLNAPTLGDCKTHGVGTNLLAKLPGRQNTHKSCDTPRTNNSRAEILCALMRPEPSRYDAAGNQATLFAGGCTRKLSSDACTVKKCMSSVTAKPRSALAMQCGHTTTFLLRMLIRKTMALHNAKQRPEYRN